MINTFEKEIIGKGFGSSLECMLLKSFDNNRTEGFLVMLEELKKMETTIKRLKEERL